MADPFLNEPWKVTKQSPVDWLDTNFHFYNRTIDEICDGAIPYKLGDGPNESGIYFLIISNEDFDDIVYIGQSLSIYARLQQHKKSGKRFTHIYFIAPIPEILLSFVEAYFINYFLPPLNGNIPSIEKSIQKHLDRARTADSAKTVALLS